MTDPRRVLEAVLFVAEEPVPIADLAQVLELPAERVEVELKNLQRDLDGRGVVLRAVAGGWRLYTHPDTKGYLERFAASDTARKISRAALEALAVVAYRQPVSRGQVSEIRGVDSEQAMRTLQRHELIAEVARDPGPGRAVLYGTTPQFLEQLGINSVAELPPLADHVPPADVVETLERPFRPEASSNDSKS